MNGYVNRLVKCKYTYNQAYKLCCDFVHNLSLFDLECFVSTVERVSNVDKVQS